MRITNIITYSSQHTIWKWKHPVEYEYEDIESQVRILNITL